MSKTWNYLSVFSDDDGTQMELPKASVALTTENNSFTGVNTFTAATAFTDSTPPTASAAPVNDTHLANKLYVDTATSANSLTIPQGSIPYGDNANNLINNGSDFIYDGSGVVLMSGNEKAFYYPADMIVETASAGSYEGTEFYNSRGFLSSRKVGTGAEGASQDAASMEYISSEGTSTALADNRSVGRQIYKDDGLLFSGHSVVKRGTGDYESVWAIGNLFNTPANVTKTHNLSTGKNTLNKYGQGTFTPTALSKTFDYISVFSDDNGTQMELDKAELAFVGEENNFTGPNTFAGGSTFNSKLEANEVIALDSHITRGIYSSSSTLSTEYIHKATTSTLEIGTQLAEGTEFAVYNSTAGILTISVGTTPTHSFADTGSAMVPAGKIYTYLIIDDLIIRKE